MNWRAIGCLGLGMAVFVGVGLLGLSMALRNTEGCPDRFLWNADRWYEAVGPATSTPDLGPGEAVAIGSTFMGPTTRRVYGPPGSSPSTRAEDRPDEIALECGDGTFQRYEWDGITLSPAPSARAGS